ncbi:hypothetical protein T310_6312, partial [Rasamsonia emersonii CBS 393.64]
SETPFLLGPQRWPTRSVGAESAPACHGLISAFFCPSQVAGDSLCASLNWKSFIYAAPLRAFSERSCMQQALVVHGLEWMRQDCSVKSRTVRPCLKMATKKLGKTPIPSAPSPTGPRGRRSWRVGRQKVN